MHGFILTIIIIILVVIGVLLFNAGTKNYVNEHRSFVLINARNTNTIQDVIQRAAKKYPDCDIYVFNRSSDPEMEKMLKIIHTRMPWVRVIN